MKQNGKVLKRFDPPLVKNSVSHLMDGMPVDVAVSPDGTKVAYTFYGYDARSAPPAAPAPPPG